MTNKWILKARKRRARARRKRWLERQAAGVIATVHPPITSETSPEARAAIGALIEAAARALEG